MLSSVVPVVSHRCSCLTCVCHSRLEGWRAKCRSPCVSPCSPCVDCPASTACTRLSTVLCRWLQSGWLEPPSSVLLALLLSAVLQFKAFSSLACAFSHPSLACSSLSLLSSYPATPFVFRYSLTRSVDNTRIMPKIHSLLRPGLCLKRGMSSQVISTMLHSPLGQ